MARYQIVNGPDRFDLAQALFVRSIGPCLNGPSKQIDVTFYYAKDDAYALACVIQAIGKSKEWNEFIIQGTCFEAGHEWHFNMVYDPVQKKGSITFGLEAEEE